MKWKSSLSSQPYAMSEEAHSTYGDLINHFSGTYPGYKRYGKPGGTTDIEIAGEISHFFHTHYYKQIHTYLTQDKYLLGNISKNKLIVLDLGAGVGTTIYSLLDMCNELSNPIVDIKCLFVEPCDIRTSFRELAWKQYCSHRTNEPVSVDVESILEKVPICKKDTINYLSKYPDYSLLVVMSNLLSWVDNSKLDKIYFLIGRKFKSVTSEFINELIEETPHSDITILNIESNSGAAKNYLKNFYDQLNISYLDKILPPYENKRIRLTNPFGHPKYPGGNTFPITFFNSIAHLKSAMIKIGQQKNIKNSFYGVMSSYRSELFYDEIEVKLMNLELDKYIDEICSLIKKGYEYIPETLHYSVPKKKNGEFRPLVIESIYNELVSGVILKYWGKHIDHEFDEKGQVCFGDRIEKANSPQVYSNFFNQYFKQYIPKAKEYCNIYKYYCKIDLVSFFKNIDKKILMERVLSLINKHDKIFVSTFENLIHREILDCEKDKGIPQGSIVSGFLANIYLQPLDSFLKDQKNIAYLRYVDDIFIFGNSEQELKEIIADVESLLKTYRLEMHHSDDEKKDSRGETAALLNMLQDDIELRNLSKTINNLIASLYFINALSDRKRYADEKSKFAKLYSECLELIEIYIPHDFLYHKLYKNALKTTLLKSFNIKKTVAWLLGKDFELFEWVTLPQDALYVSKQNWYNEFKSKSININYLDKLDSCRKELSLMLEEASEKYLDPNPKQGHDTNYYLRRLKFTLKRAGVIKVAGIEKILISYLDKPWILQHRTLRAYPELYSYIWNDFSDKHKQDYFYLRAIWLLGEWNMQDRQVNKELYNLFVTRYTDTLTTNTPESVLENTFLTEAILKKGLDIAGRLSNVSYKYINDQADRLRKKVITFDQIQYHKLRNAYVLLNYSCPDMVIFHDEFCCDFRMKLLCDVLSNRKGLNPLCVDDVLLKEEEVEDILYPVLPPYAISESY